MNLMYQNFFQVCLISNTDDELLKRLDLEYHIIPTIYVEEILLTFLYFQER